MTRRDEIEDWREFCQAQPPRQVVEVSPSSVQRTRRRWVTRADLAEAQAAIARLAEAPTDDDLVARNAMVLRLRACSRVPAATRSPTATIRTATATWRHRWASRGI
jgi:hypothetical protein